MYRFSQLLEDIGVITAAVSELISEHGHRDVENILPGVGEFETCGGRSSFGTSMRTICSGILASSRAFTTCEVTFLYVMLASNQSGQIFPKLCCSLVRPPRVSNTPVHHSTVRVAGDSISETSPSVFMVKAVRPNQHSRTSLTVFRSGINLASVGVEVAWVRFDVRRSSFISPSAMLLGCCEGVMVCDMISCVAAMSDGKAMKRAINLHILSVDTRSFRSSWSLCQLFDCSVILVVNDKDNKQLLEFLPSTLLYVYQTSIDDARNPGTKWTGLLLSS